MSANVLPTYGAFRHTADDMVTAVNFGGSAGMTYPAGLIGGDAAGWSWCGWFWANTLTARNILLGFEANTPTFGYSGTGCVQFSLNGGGFTTGDVSQAFTAKRWVHGGVSISPLPGGVGYDWSIYHFGEVVSSGRSATGTFIAHATAPTASLGASSRIGRQTLWRRGITQAEVRAHYYAGTAAGAVADWRMDESIGSVSVDRVTGLAGRQLSVTLGSGGFWTTDTPKRGVMLPREFGSILLPGTAGSNVLMTANSVLPNLVGAAEITIAAWSKPRAGGSILCARSGASPALRLQLSTSAISGSGHAAMLDGETVRVVVSQQPLSDPIPQRARWRHQSITFRPAAGQVDFFVAGALVNRNTGVAFNGAPFSLSAGNSKLSIGEDPDGGGGAYPFDGWIGPVEIYTDPLTLAQQRSLYLTGNAGVLPAYRWSWQERTGTVANSSGSKFAVAGALQGSAAWSLDQPW